MTSDWVQIEAARLNCTIETAFKQLHEQVAKDFETFQRLGINASDKEFLLDDARLSEGTFLVACKYPGLNYIEAVSFNRMNNHIGISDSRNRNAAQRQTVTVFWDEGEKSCAMLLNGQRLHVSEISKVALRSFLFPS